jgi:hypothetical protein
LALNVLSGADGSLCIYFALSFVDSAFMFPSRLDSETERRCGTSRVRFILQKRGLRRIPSPTE